MHFGVAIAGLSLLIAAEPAPTDEQVRGAVERSLPFVMAEGEKWIAEKKCVTCHQVPFMVWALNAAAERGVELDRRKREECNSWATSWKNMATKEDLERGEEHTLARHSDPVAQLLLGRSRTRGATALTPALSQREDALTLALSQREDALTLALSQREREEKGDALTRPPLADALSEREREEKQETLTPALSRREDALTLALSQRERGNWVDVFAERLAAGQQEDGSWKAGGQLPAQKRPERETQEVSTMWSLVALQSYAAPAEAVEDRFATARKWLGSKTEGQSTEWWAVRLLLERGSGNDAEADRLRAELLARQRDDGGWGWLCADESDAFGTGVALYALARDGLGYAAQRPMAAASGARGTRTADESAIARGRAFLLKTQKADGSWLVNGTKKNKAKQVEATATYWGTCWAVIGLVETMGAEGMMKDEG